MKTCLCVAGCIAGLALAPLTYPNPLQTHVGFAPLYALLAQRFAEAELGMLPALLAALLTRSGLTPLMTLKTLEALALGVGAMGMFMLARQWQGDAAGLLASALYSMLPYRLMTTYVRGATGEAWFWGLLPGGLWLIVIVTTQRKNFAPLVTGCLSGLFVLALWWLCVPRTDEAPQPVYLFQLFSATWNYGSQGTWLDAVPLQLGLAPLGLSAIAVWLRPERRTLSLAISAGVCVVLCIVPFSGWWHWAWLLNAPWQLVGFAGFLLCLLGSSIVHSMGVDTSNHRATRQSPLAIDALPIFAAILTCIVLASYSYLTPRGLDNEPTTPPLARFGHEAYLVSATITPTLAPNTTFTVTLLWQNLRPFTDDYKVFVHVVDAQEKIWAQRDAVPLNGTRPTRTWQRGELLRDMYTFALPLAAPHDLRLAVGFYRADNGVRLQTSAGSDRVVVSP